MSQTAGHVVDWDTIAEKQPNFKRPVPGRLAPLAKIESFYDDMESCSLLPPSSPASQATYSKRDSYHERIKRVLAVEKMTLVRQFDQPLSSQQQNGQSLLNENCRSVSADPQSPKSLLYAVDSNGNDVDLPSPGDDCSTPTVDAAASDTISDASPSIECNSWNGVENQPLIDAKSIKSSVVIAAAANLTKERIENQPEPGSQPTTAAPPAVVSRSDSEKRNVVNNSQKLQQPQPQQQQQEPPMDEKTRQKMEKLERSLMEAVLTERPSQVKSLLKRNVSIPSSSPAKVKPFHAAVSSGKEKVVKAFIDVERSLVNEPNRTVDGAVALHVAVKNRQTEIVQLLVDRGRARLDVKNSSGDDVWDILRSQSSGKNNSNINEMASTLLALFRKYYKDYTTTPLHEAAATGRVDKIDYLISIGFDVWIEDKAGYSILHLAAFNNHPQVINHLFKSKQTSKLSSAGGSSAAAGVERKNTKTGKTALHVAANRSNVESVMALLGHGARPTVLDTAGWTALHDAAASRFDDDERRSPEVIRILSVRSAEMTGALTADGETPLHVAARHGRLGAVRALIDIDSSVLTVRDGDGWTPLHAAVKSRQAAVVRALLQSSVDSLGSAAVQKLTQGVDKSGKTPRQLAVELDADGLAVAREIDAFC